MRRKAYYERPVILVNFKGNIYPKKYMRFIHFLKPPQLITEEYAFSFDADAHSNVFRGGYTEVFVNPSKLEIANVSKETVNNNVRFTIDLDDNKIYIWKPDSVHYTVDAELRGRQKLKYLNRIIQGIAEAKSGKLKILTKENQSIYYDRLRGYDVTLSEDKISWLKQYFDIESIKYICRRFNLSEKYTMTYKNAEIFVNPDHSEVIDLVNKSEFGSLRLLIDNKKKKVWVVDAIILHEMFGNELVKRGKIKKDAILYKGLFKFFKNHKKDEIIIYNDKYNADFWNIRRKSSVQYFSWLNRFFSLPERLLEIKVLEN